MSNGFASQRSAGPGRMDGYGEQLAPGERSLACYAATAVPSRGRRVDEPACPMRNYVQRDRDRVLHSTAFRRLIYKTQMFVFHEGDHYRTRLTHSLEVAQIARAVARQLRLDEDLAEGLALAHDLGHPPFGHAGERALQRVFGDIGGFNHNVQSFRIVTELERRYPGFDGLNLCWETLEGLVKHNGPLIRPDGASDEVLLRAIRRFQAQMDLEPAQFASAEAQVAALADDIAWMTHDIDDGLRAGLIVPDDLKEVGLVAPLIEGLVGRSGDGSVERDFRVYEVVRQLITLLVGDLIATSRERLAALEPGTPDEIRHAPEAVVRFSPARWADLKVLRSFLFKRLYRHEWVVKVMNNAETIVSDLVARYLAEPEEMAKSWRARARASAGGDQRRVVADFVAGMTDRYAIGEHRRLFDATPDLR